MRLTARYARSRNLPSAAVVLLVLCGAGAWAGRWLGTRPELDPADARTPVTVALAAAAAVVLGGTLHSPAHEIEQTTPRRWSGWRAGHAAAAALFAAAAAAPVLPPAAHGQEALLRNTAGLLGLALITAAVIGPRLAWTIPLGYATTVYLAAGTTSTGSRPVWAFVMQPAGSTTATTTALCLLVGGSAAWARTARAAMR